MLCIYWRSSHLVLCWRTAQSPGLMSPSTHQASPTHRCEEALGEISLQSIVTKWQVGSTIPEKVIAANWWNQYEGHNSCFNLKKITNKMRRTLAQKIFLGLLLLHIWGSQHLVVTEPHISCSWHQLDQAWKYSGSWLEGMTGGTTVDRGDSEFSLLTQACLQCCCCCCWKWAETQGEDPPCLRMLKNV